MSYLNSTYQLKDIRFKADTIELIFTDGRLLISPLKNFPAIKKLQPAQRKKYHIIGGEGFDFDDSDEVYHIADFVGNGTVDFSKEKNQSMINEPLTDYKRTRKKKSLG